jgi:DNA-binding transcriptional regulator LsrR (DeoR family)
MIIMIKSVLGHEDLMKVLSEKTGKSQKEVSEIMNMSRPSVNRAIQRAKELGIVKIEITRPVLKNISLEKALCDKFNIDKAIVVSNILDKEDNQFNLLGRAGADFIQENARDGMVIGFSMGETLKKVADAINTDRKLNSKIVPLLGGMGYVRPDIHPNEICRVVAEKLGGSFYPLYVPSVAGSKYERDILMKDNSVREVFDLALHADIIFVGAGTLESSKLSLIGSMPEADVKSVAGQGGVGDIGTTCYLDANGQQIENSFFERLVGPGFRKIRENAKVVLVAGGKSKYGIMKAIMAGKWADVIITDEGVAKYLLQQ